MPRFAQKAEFKKVFNKWQREHAYRERTAKAASGEEKRINAAQDKAAARKAKRLKAAKGKHVSGAAAEVI